MNRSIRMFPLLALLALAGCVSSDGSKPIKQEDPAFRAYYQSQYGERRA